MLNDELVSLRTVLQLTLSHKNRPPKMVVVVQQQLIETLLVLIMMIAVL